MSVTWSQVAIESYGLSDDGIDMLHCFRVLSFELDGSAGDCSI